MPEFAADHDSRFIVERSLFRVQLFRCRATRNRCFPAGQLFIALLGIGMPQAVELGQTHIAKPPLVAMQLLDVIELSRDQRAALD